MSGSLAACLVLCVVWLKADCGSADVPHNSAADGALNSAADGVMDSASVGMSSAILVGRSVESHITLANSPPPASPLEETCCWCSELSC